MGVRTKWRAIMDSTWLQAVRKWYAPIEKLDGLLGVWERIPGVVKSGGRWLLVYLIAQFGAALAALALDVGVSNWPLIVVGAALVTLPTAWLLEHFVFGRQTGSPAGTVVVRKIGRGATAEGSGEITATAPVYVPEDQAVSAPQPGHSLKALIEEAEFQAAACTTGHRILEDSVELGLSFLSSPALLSKITCVIVDPAGVHTSAEGDSPSLYTFMANSDIKLRYPEHFPGGTRLRTGNYSVTWLSESTMTGFSMFSRPHIIARDAFKVG